MELGIIERAYVLVLDDVRVVEDIEQLCLTLDLLAIAFAHFLLAHNLRQHSIRVP